MLWRQVWEGADRILRLGFSGRAGLGSISWHGLWKPRIARSPFLGVRQGVVGQWQQKRFRAGFRKFQGWDLGNGKDIE